jgi:hypothetical protein
LILSSHSLSDKEEDDDYDQDQDQELDSDILTPVEMLRPGAME